MLYLAHFAYETVFMHSFEPAVDLKKELKKQLEEVKVGLEVECETVQRDCPLCASSVHTAKKLPYGNHLWQVVQCQHCQFVYLPKIPVYERLSEEFAWEKTSEQERFIKQQREPLKQRFSQTFKQWRRRYIKRDKLPVLIQRYILPGNVLDIGCAAGGLLAALPSAYIPYGVEISKALSEQANMAVLERGGYVVHNNALDGTGAFAAEFFSGVIMSAFLEHERQALQLLEQVRRVLRPDGVAIIKVPNFASINRVVRARRWCGFRLPDHVNYFTPTTLRALVEKSGLKPIQFSFLDRLPTSDNMWMVVGPNNI